MITCPQCDRPMPSGTYMCDRCYGSPTDPILWPHGQTYSVKGVGIAAVVAAVVAVVINLITAWSPLVGAQSADAGDSAGGYQIIALVTLVDVLMQPLVIVLTIIWLWRARKNLDAFPNGGGVLGAGWAIGAWFIPLANIVLTGRMVHGVASRTLHQKWAGAVAILWCVTYWAPLPMLWFVPDPPANGLDADHAAYMRGTLLTSNLIEVGLLAVAGGCLSAIIIAVSRTQESRIARGRAGQWPAIPLTAPMETTLS